MKISRRELLQSGVTAAAAPILLPGISHISLPRRSAAETVNIAIMGVNGRGSDLAKEFVKQRNVEVTVLCEVDDKVVSKGLAAVATRQSRVPKVEKDIRKVLEMSYGIVLVVKQLKRRVLITSLASSHQSSTLWLLKLLELRTVIN